MHSLDISILESIYFILFVTRVGPSDQNILSIISYTSAAKYLRRLWTQVLRLSHILDKLLMPFVFSFVCNYAKGIISTSIILRRS